MYTDENGIIRFETLEKLAPLQAKLNTALESVSVALDNRLQHLDADNIVEGRLGIEHRPEGLPYAMAAGFLEMNGTGTQDFSLPANRFTQPPIITISGASSTQSPTQDVRAFNITTTGFSVRYQVASNWQTEHTGTRPFYWIAVQMSENNAEG